MITVTNLASLLGAMVFFVIYLFVRVTISKKREANLLGDISRLLGEISRDTTALDNATKKIEKVSTERECLLRELAIAQRKSSEYFDLIERVIAQRDERWSMFLEHSAQHLNAQNTLEQQLRSTWHMLGQAVDLVNVYRNAEKSPLLVKPAAPRLGIAKQFEDMIEKMKSTVSPTIDAIAERDKIKAADDDQ